jgi:hypothetical protein
MPTIFLTPQSMKYQALLAAPHQPRSFPSIIKCDLQGSKVVITSVPRVMVEGFLKEYLCVGDVIGTELHTVGCYFTGFISGLVVKHRALEDYFGDRKPDIGIGTSSLYDHLSISSCKRHPGNFIWCSRQNLETEHNLQLSSRIHLASRRGG